MRPWTNWRAASRGAEPRDGLAGLDPGARREHRRRGRSRRAGAARAGRVARAGADRGGRPRRREPRAGRRGGGARDPGERPRRRGGDDGRCVGVGREAGRRRPSARARRPPRPSPTRTRRPRGCSTTLAPPPSGCARRATRRLRSPAPRRPPIRNASGPRPSASPASCSRTRAKSRRASHEETREHTERLLQARREELIRLDEQAKEQARAGRTHAREEARQIVTDAHAVSNEVLAEGTEISRNLRELAASLRNNAERLLRDVRLTHGAMTAQLDQVAPSERAALEREAGEPGGHERQPARRRRTGRRARRAGVHPAPLEHGPAHPLLPCRAGR